MVDFTESMRLKGKAEEDLYFAELDRKLIEALHKKQYHELNPEEDRNIADSLSPPLK